MATYKDMADELQRNIEAHEMAILELKEKAGLYAHIVALEAALENWKLVAAEAHKATDSMRRMLAAVPVDAIRRNNERAAEFGAVVSDIAEIDLWLDRYHTLYDPSLAVCD